MWYNQLKTAVLLASLSGLLMLLGSYLGGTQGITIAFILALAMNGIAYFFSDKIVLTMYNAKPLDTRNYGWIKDTVQELAQKAHIPMPTLWMIDTPLANAFATGRNPKHASVAVTTGILSILTKEELRGVLAHELSHVKNRDILISTVAATLATAIGYVANMMQYAAYFGATTGNGERRRGNPIAMIFIAILMPIAASLIQLAISRSREYQADDTGAKLCHDPLALASALQKLQTHTASVHLNSKNAEEAATAHMFIVNPFSARGLVNLFSTHPPMQQRVARLRALYETMSRGR